MVDALLKVGTQTRFAVAGSLSPVDPATDYTIGTPTDVTLTLSGVADGAGRQSNKADLGANRAAAFEVMAAVDFTGETPAADTTVRFYWAPSTHATAANGNVAGNSGVDAAAPNGTVPSGLTLSEFIAQCDFIGALVLSDDASVQCGFVGVFSPSSRYGQLIVVNESGDAFEADNVEAHVVFNPIVDTQP